ncbi:MAG TPA: hypothetical protein VHY08_21755 [Bacillota bacterium]|nr:hypothetical protein [Bacillota bacterium]
MDDLQTSSTIDRKAAGPKQELRTSDVINALFGEATALKLLLLQVNWWYVGLSTGLIAAVTHLILISNPNICYWYAKSQVRGLEMTLPEAMANVSAWGWFNLILTPLIRTLILALAGFLICRISQGTKRNDFHGFREHFGLVTLTATILLLGQITGYLMVGAQDLNALADLRDLTPGVGLGLLPWFAVERIGLFAREMVRSFDLFGIWAVLLGTSVFRAINGFSRLKSFTLVLIYYGIFLGLRWLIQCLMS